MNWERLLATIAAAALLSCSGDSGPSDPGGGGGTSPTVAVSNNSFSPSTLQAPLNSTVTWQWNSGGVEHNVTFETAPNSGNRTSGSFSRAFPTAGSFGYLCTIHGAGMSGVVNVSAGTGGGGDGGGGYGP
jgi:plastocyanin